MYHIAIYLFNQIEKLNSLFKKKFNLILENKIFRNKFFLYFIVIYDDRIKSML